MPATEDNSEAIREADEILDSGVTATAADGHSVTIDLEFTERRQRERKLRDTASVAAGRVRPVMPTVNLRTPWGY